MSTKNQATDHRIEVQLSDWKAGLSKSVTFIVTEACQLQCGYCYFVGKNTDNRMGLDIAKQTLDYLLNNREQFPEEAIVLDFIGGEPFLEIELIDKICDHFKRAAYDLDHSWFENYIFSFTTNGLLYDDQAVQRYIDKNRKHIDITITIDGTREKHDLNRRYPSGQGSYDDVVEMIPLWLRQFPDANTKVTVSHADLPYVCESIIHIWELGIKDINSNVVFEDVWEEGDDRLLEEQLVQLADIIIDRDYYKTRSCSFFNRGIGHRDNSEGNWCGTGKMLAVDHKGDFYPCVRFAGFSLENKAPIVVGNCFDGLDENRLRPFLALNRTAQSPKVCIDCEVAVGCAWCQGANYDFADNDTIYQRAVYICDMHKARVRANNYFWHKYDKAVGRAR